MPRVARKKSSTGYYHIVFRGINKQNIFFDNEDREVLLNRLKLVQNEVDYKLIAFCLMNNHVHLLMKEEQVEIGAVMRKVLSSYVFWYNSKYERVGNLFLDRFRSEPIEDDKHMLCCVRYILQNPLKAMLCDNVWEYQWSSASLLLDENKSFVDDEMVKEMLQTRENLVSFFEEQEKTEFLEWETKMKLTDEKLKQKIERLLKNEGIDDIINKDKIQRDKILKKIMKIDGANVLQVSRITGVPYHFIRNLE